MKSMTFFGGGHMASAMIAGMQRANQLPPHLMLVDPDAQARQRWSDCYGARTFEHVAQEPCLSDCWLMAVKPQQMKSLCAAIAGLHAQPSRCVISVAAGIRLARLQSWLGPQHRYIRCMPNTPAVIGRGVTALFAASDLASDDRMFAQTMMACVGRCLWVDAENSLDAVTAVSGSGPAYVFRLIEAMQAAAQALGLNAQDARLLVLETFTGASELAAQSALTPAELREQVTSKGGTTAAALEVFSQEDLSGIIARALTRAAARSAELADLVD